MAPSTRPPIAIEFDQIYREHLANVYRSLGVPAPPELSQPILKISRDETQVQPHGPISPTINGKVDSYFEWLGAGSYKVDQRSGSMHGKRTLVKEVHYGGDDGTVFIRIDFGEDSTAIEGLEVQTEMPGASGRPESKMKVTLKGEGVSGGGGGRQSGVQRCSGNFVAADGVTGQDQTLILAGWPADSSHPASGLSGDSAVTELDVKTRLNALRWDSRLIACFSFSAPGGVRHSTSEYFLVGHLLAVHFAIRVVIGTQCRAFQREAGKDSARTRVRKHFRVHLGIGLSGGIAAHRTGRGGRLGTQRELVASRCFMPRSFITSRIRSDSEPPICRPKLPPSIRIAAGADQPAPPGRRHMAKPRPYFGAEDEAGAFHVGDDDDALRLVHQVLRNAFVGGVHHVRDHIRGCIQTICRLLSLSAANARGPMTAPDGKNR